MRDFKGKCAVITGAGAGIGAALARRAATEGMKLVLADIAEDLVQAVAAELQGVEVVATRCDVADQASVQALADMAYDRFGAVDLLCNNAGVVPGGRHRKAWEYSVADWDWSLGVNFYGVVHGMRAFVPRMIAADRPAHVLNTASVSGFISGSGSACYSAAKHAMVRVTEGLYAGLQEIGAPIGVTMLCPGLVRTGIYDAEKQRPERYANADGAPPESAELAAMLDDLYRSATTPDEAADIAFRGIIEDRFYVFTSTAFDPAIEQRGLAIIARENPRFESLVKMSRRDAGLDLGELQE